MPEPNSVLDVLTVKREDNRPVLEMTLAEINQASDQPTEDTAWDKYTADEFTDGTRHELHMDWYNPDTDGLERVVDGREAQWDATNEVISIQLQRSDVALAGEYYFEWVIVYDAADADGNVPSSETATEVNTVPSRGFFNLTVEPPTSRTLGEISPIDRTVGTLTVEDLIRGVNGPVPISQSQPTATNHATTKQYVDSGLGDKADLDGDGTQQLLGNAFVDLVPIPEPDAPVGAAWRFFRHNVDGSLKVKDENGDKVTLASQP